MVRALLAIEPHPRRGALQIAERGRRSAPHHRTTRAMIAESSRQATNGE
jgi:hypothetical protein